VRLVVDADVDGEWVVVVDVDHEYENTALFAPQVAVEVVLQAQFLAVIFDCQGMALAPRLVFNAGVNVGKTC
jgi:hypothetical protein